VGRVGPTSPWRRRWRVAVALAVVGIAVVVSRASADNGGSTTVGGNPTDDGGIVAIGHSDGSDDGDHPDRDSGRPRHCDYFLQDSAGGNIGAGGLKAGPKVAIGELRASIEVDTMVIRVCTWLDTGERGLPEVLMVSPDAVAAARRAASLAAAQLVLPLPSPHTSPPGRTVDNVATWLWVDDAVAPPRSATNAGVTATVMAVPVRLVWRTGDGHTVICAGSGTPYEPSNAAAEPGGCRHVYSLPTTTVAMQVTAVWRLEWTATNGQTGDLGEVSRVARSPLEVDELITVLRTE
jgi:hypothetical protein